ncbi:hypothetical protein HDE_04464 [Halotydeus destructor]|nr:hypothetical protein HDE_04464 [Halotydeus destructor]
MGGKLLLLFCFVLSAAAILEADDSYLHKLEVEFKSAVETVMDKLSRLIDELKSAGKHVGEAVAHNAQVVGGMAYDAAATGQDKLVQGAKVLPDKLMDAQAGAQDAIKNVYTSGRDAIKSEF